MGQRGAGAGWDGLELERDGAARCGCGFGPARYRGQRGARAGTAARSASGVGWRGTRGSEVGRRGGVAGFAMYRIIAAQIRGSEFADHTESRQFLVSALGLLNLQKPVFLLLDQDRLAEFAKKKIQYIRVADARCTTLYK